MAPRHEHIDVHIPGLEELVLPMRRLLEKLVKQGVQIMAILDELRAQLNAAKTKADETGTTVTEIASDMNDLIAKLASGAPGSEEVVAATAEATALTAQLTAMGDALKSIADKHTP